MRCPIPLQIRNATVAAERSAAATSATALRKSNLDAALKRAGKPSIAELKARCGDYEVNSTENLGTYLAHRVTAAFSLKEALRRVDAMIAATEAAEAKARAEAERERKLAAVNAALHAAGEHRPFERVDREIRQVVESALAPSGILLSDGDATHVHSPEVLEAVTSAVRALLQRRADEVSAYTERQKKRRALRSAMVAVGLDYGYAEQADEELRRVVEDALSAGGVSLHDPDPSHVISPESYQSAAAAARGLYDSRAAAAAECARASAPP